jgi:hypothetical protein
MPPVRPAKLVGRCDRKSRPAKDPLPISVPSHGRSCGKRCRLHGSPPHARGPTLYQRRLRCASQQMVGSKCRDGSGTPFSATARNVGSTPNIDRNSNSHQVSDVPLATWRIFTAPDADCPARFFMTNHASLSSTHQEPGKLGSGGAATFQLPRRLGRTAQSRCRVRNLAQIACVPAG